MSKKIKSASSGQSVSFVRKTDEAVRQLAMLFGERSFWMKPDFSDLARDYAIYEKLVAQYAGLDLKTARVFEIGCGQRPHRLYYMLASGVDAYGIELEPILFRPTPARVLASVRQAGAERTIKTLARRVLFDVPENRHLKRYFSERQGRPFRWPIERLIQGSAADARLWPAGEFDFIFSEVVFEHIPPADMAKVCDLMAEHMSDRAIAFIKPAIFTGIRGGHSVEWYNPARDVPRKCPPWDHLRANLYPANAYMNKLRIADYRRIFGARFDILHEEEFKPDMGRQYLTPQIKAELSQYSEEELLSNDRIFILRKRRTP